MSEEIKKNSSDSLQIKALEIAKLLNGLTIREAKDILDFISRSFENNSIVHFDSNPTV